MNANTTDVMIDFGWIGTKVAIVTHVDLDGVAAGVIVNHGINILAGPLPPEISTYFVGYNRSVGKRMIEGLSEANFAYVFVTDISLRNERGEPNMDLFLDYVKYHPRTRFFYWDHHASTDVEALLDAALANLSWRVETDESAYKCGTDVAYEELWQGYGLDNDAEQDIVGSIKRLVEFAHDYDITKPDGEWRQDCPQSKNLTDIIEVLGPRKVYDILCKSIDFVTRYPDYEPMMDALEKAWDVRNASLAMLAKHSMEFEVGRQKVHLGVCAGSYNDACKELAGDDKDVVAIALDLHREGGFSPSLSVRRASGSAVDCKEIAEKLGGGGHVFAAGGRISKDFLIDELLMATANYIRRSLGGPATADSDDLGSKTVTVVVSGGCVTDVLNLPPGYELEIKDYDIHDITGPDEVDGERIFADEDGCRYERLAC